MYECIPFDFDLICIPFDFDCIHSILILRTIMSTFNDRWQLFRTSTDAIMFRKRSLKMCEIERDKQSHVTPDKSLSQCTIQYKGEEFGSHSKLTVSCLSG